MLFLVIDVIVPIEQLSYKNYNDNNYSNTYSDSANPYTDSGNISGLKLRTVDGTTDKDLEITVIGGFINFKLNNSFYSKILS